MTVQLASRWLCVGASTYPHEACDAHGEGPGSDLAARKHLAATGHATATFTTPKAAT